ncbi:FeoA family protein [Williamsia deligens]|uniref:Ferrous iron transport protein A n=1 Tax=Williamsia deligens TaxID=321325 RepID=A0ABW3G4N5_9NOCA|nr:FeoA family protein [Williamsia deligens]MCP2194126.1 ferrous iron transport protein A [Williamsia deligens]
MSVMTERLGSRVVGSLPTTAAPDTAVEDTVADLRPGSHAVVARLCEAADPATARRYFDLGFIPGAEIAVVRRAPMGGPVVVRVAGYEIALRRGQARCIKVDRTAGPAHR